MSNKKIAHNTIILYIRMMFVMCITFYTSRIVLNALGVDNYGIYNLVAGLIAFWGFITNSMAIGVQRFLAFNIGKNDMAATNSFFSMAVNIHLLFALVISLILFIIGDLLITRYLSLPVESYHSVTILFRYMVISACFSVGSVPFIGLIISYERMGILAFINIIEALIRLLVAYMIIWVEDENKLEFYGLLQMIAGIIIFSIYVILCKIKFKNIKYSPKWNNSVFIELVGFSSWSALGELAWSCTIQGVNIVLNVFYGVVCNAAYGIASQISSGVNKFVGSFQMAINPQIIKRYATCEVDSMLYLVFGGIKFSFFLVMILAIPCLLCMPYILELWLGIVPGYAVEFSRLIIVTILFDTLSNLFATVAKAYGKIRKYQLWVSVVLFMNLPLSYLILKLGFPPENVFWIYCGVSSCLLYLRLYLIGQMIGRNISIVYAKNVLLPIMKVVLLCGIVTYIGYELYNSSLYYLIILSSLLLLFMSLAIYRFGLTSEERNYILVKLKRTFNK